MLIARRDFFKDLYNLAKKANNRLNTSAKERYYAKDYRQADILDAHDSTDDIGLHSDMYARSVDTPSRISVTAPESTVVCEVREYNGRIGLFKDGSSAPYRVIDYDVALMPDFDREQLREGVVMETEEELRRFMEDIAT